MYARLSRLFVVRRRPIRVSITSLGSNKIQLIKLVRELTGLGLREAKDLVESPLPHLVKGGYTRDQAESVLKRLTEIGSEGRVERTAS